jgi:uncharacterized OB-fold protein
MKKKSFCNGCGELTHDLKGFCVDCGDDKDYELVGD